MTIEEKRQATDAIRKMALMEGVDEAAARRELQAAIDEAWNNPAGRAAQQRIFPEGKPSVEEFIFRVSQAAGH